jgi:hypothetical protein
MTRAYIEGDDPRVTVTLGGDIYASTGLLHNVIRSTTRKGADRTALFIDRGWMFDDPDTYDRASGFIGERVFVTWRLAHGRRYVRSLDRAAAKGDTGTR